MSLTEQEKKQVEDYLNLYRSKHRAPPIKWDNAITNVSQTWSNHLLNTNQFLHSKNRTYGENLYMSGGLKFNNKVDIIKKAIDSWYSEIKLYDFKVNQYKSGTGHFTALVWKNVTTFGFGVSIEPTKNKIIVCYNCSPVVNILSQFNTNVFPPQ